MSDSTFFEPHLDILPEEQRICWSLLNGVSEEGFVLYGGTALALRLGHRQSVDFDFSMKERGSSLRSNPCDPANRLA